MQKLEVTEFPVTDLNPYYRNPRKGNVAAIAESLVVHGQYRPIVVNVGTLTGRPLEILAGNHTWQASVTLGWERIAGTTVDVDDAEAARIVAADNRLADLGGYDDALLAEVLGSAGDLAGTGYSDDDLARLLQPVDARGVDRLLDRFGAPPLSVLSARGGGWAERKRAWIDLGLRSEEGRDGQLVYDSPQTRFSNWYAVKNAAEEKAGHRLSDRDVVLAHAAELLALPGNGTSVFDPALTELVYAWFSAPGMRILDPWAGGSVRGVVAAVLGREYTGIELRPEQVAANRLQLDVIGAGVRAGMGVGGVIPEWLGGDSEELLSLLPDESYDMAFSAPPRYLTNATQPEWVEGESTVTLAEMDAASYDLAFGCPPYYDLEKYGDDPRDLSNLSHSEFDAQMIRNIAGVARVLRDDSWAVFVVGNVRDKQGHILDMRRCMSNAAEAAGLHLVNDAILLTPIGTAAPRAARSFQGTRTLTRVHQEVLVYVKGNRKRAALRCGEVEALALTPIEVDDERG